MIEALYKKPAGCMLSRIVGKNITHKVIEHEDFGLKIVSAGGSRQSGKPVYWGTYEECSRFLDNKKRFDRW